MEAHLLVRHDLLETDDVLVTQLTQDLDFSDGRDGEPLLLVLQPDLLERVLLLVQRFGNSLWRLQH